MEIWKRKSRSSLHTLKICSLSHLSFMVKKIKAEKKQKHPQCHFTPTINKLILIGAAELPGSSTTGIYCGRKFGVDFFYKEIMLPWWVGDSTSRTQCPFRYLLDIITILQIRLYEKNTHLNIHVYSKPDLPAFSVIGVNPLPKQVLYTNIRNINLQLRFLFFSDVKYLSSRMLGPVCRVDLLQRLLSVP